jgi:hypothetical protein
MRIEIAKRGAYREGFRRTAECRLAVVVFAVRIGGVAMSFFIPGSNSPRSTFRFFTTSVGGFIFMADPSE